LRTPVEHFFTDTTHTLGCDYRGLTSAPVAINWSPTSDRESVGKSSHLTLTLHVWLEYKVQPSNSLPSNTYPHRYVRPTIYN